VASVAVVIDNDRRMPPFSLSGSMPIISSTKMSKQPYDHGGGKNIIGCACAMFDVFSV
jgi:hypothetical protein